MKNYYIGEKLHHNTRVLVEKELKDIREKLLSKRSEPLFSMVHTSHTLSVKPAPRHCVVRATLFYDCGDHLFCYTLLAYFKQNDGSPIHKELWGHRSDNIYNTKAHREEYLNWSSIRVIGPVEYVQKLCYTYGFPQELSNDFFGFIGLHQL